MSAIDELLRWIVDPRRDAPAEHAIDRAAACSRIVEHRLCGRYLERCARSTAPAGGEALRTLVEREHRSVLAMISRQVEALREIAGLERAPEMVVLKGMATYQLTGDAGVARTGDIDVVIDESVDIEPILSRLGYERTKAPFLHEIGEFTRHDIELDVQSYFPVHRCPEVEFRSELSSPALGGRRIRRHSSLHRQATFHHFLESSLPGRGSAANLRFSGPELLAIVLAAHSFMNYANAWSISHREKAYVRLGELLDIERLLGASDFDRAQFETLADELNAESALTWVNTAATTLIDRTLIPGLPLPSALPPRCLWWDLWLDAPPDPRLLLADGWFDIEPVANALGAGSVASGRWVVVEPGGSGSLATSVSAPQLSVCLDSRLAVPQVTVRVAPTTWGDSIRVRLDRGSWAIECVGTAGMGLASVAGAGARVTWTSGPEYEEVSILCTGARRRGAVLVGVGHGRDGRIDEATMIALREF